MTVANLIPNKNNHIDLVLTPIKDSNQINDASVHKLISESEYTALYVEVDNIKNAIAELNSVLKTLQAGKEGREIRYQILERRPATISVTIDDDEMGCTAEITTALGGTHLSAKAILTAAQETGTNRGFKKEQLIKLAQNAAKEPPGSTVTAQIAWGKEPVKGKDSLIKPLVESAQNRILKPKENDDGSVDMRDLGDIICVKVGDPLVQKIPLTEGKEGYTVTGTPLAPEPGEDIPLTPGEGTTVSPKNENVLLSTLVGLPRVINNGMEVDEVYKIKNVDVSTGHIKFLGSVIISGDVCEGMTVEATGDITIGGFVESASLKAGGDITIGSGIIGKKHDLDNLNIHDVVMSVNIEAGGNIYAKYCQYAKISCHDILMEKQLMHCLLNIGGKVWVGTLEKANGILIAGHINVCTSVHAGVVGAKAGASTTIHFDKRVREYKEIINQIEANLKVETEKTDELRNASNKLKKLPKEKAQPEMLKKVISTYQHHAKRMGEILLEKEAAEELLEVYKTSVCIEATEKLYHGVEMFVGDFHDRSRREYGPTRMIYKERKIILDPIVHD